MKVKFINYLLLLLVAMAISCSARGPKFSSYNANHYIPNVKKKTYSLQTVSTNKKSNLAAVCVIDFINLTGKQQYDWLSPSLASAVDNSMSAKFEYEIFSAKLLGSYLAEIKDSSSKEKLSLSVQEAVKNNTVDIVIYGSYVLKGSNGIQMSYSVFYKKENNNVVTQHQAAQLDNSLFSTTEKIATSIVNKILNHELKR